MRIGGVLEEVEDPLFLHQARGKIEVRFAVLHAKIPWLVLTLGFDLELDAIQYLRQDIRHVFILKDAALPRLREQPQLRNNLHSIERKIRITAALGKSVNYSMKVSRGPVALDQLYHHRFPEDVRRLDHMRRSLFGILLMAKADRKFEQARNGFVPIDR